MNETQHMGQAHTGEQIHESGAHSSHDSVSSLIVVGTETAVFDRDSRVRERILSYGRFFEDVTIVVLCSGSYKQETVKNVTLIPTNSKLRIGRILHGIALASILPEAAIVTVQDPFETGIVGWLIARKKNAALHVQVHTDFLSPEYKKLSVINRVRVWIAGFILRRATRIRVVSNRIKKSIEDKYALSTPISVLPIFVDLERFRNLTPDPQLSQKFSNFNKRLLVVGRLEPEKNHQQAIKSFSEAFSERPDVCLIILGDGSMRPSLEKLADSLKISSRVFFEGRRDPAPYYSISNLVIVPSAYEGYGLVIVEALAAGLPVFANDVGVAEEVGAVMSSSEKMTEMFKAWFDHGPFGASLEHYPYNNFDDYARKYSEDILSCTKPKKSI